MTKQDYANTMGTLLCLDRAMVSDLMNLSEPTLKKMYLGYIENAKRVNFNNEFSGVINTCLPPVGMYVLIQNSKGDWDRVKRKAFVPDRTVNIIEAYTSDGIKKEYPRGGIKWKHC